MKEEWVVFRTKDGKELASYTVKGTFKGELESTIDLLASEHGIRREDICVTIEQKVFK
jgi:hypothetical protein